MKIKFRALLLSFSLLLGVAKAQVNVVAHLNNASTFTATWIKLGTLALAQGGNTAVIRISSGAGYNAVLSQMGSIEINFRTSNNASVVNGFAFTAYAYQTGYTKPISSVKIVPNADGVSAMAYDIYIYSAAYIGYSVYEVVASTGSWTRSETVAADPGTSAFTVPLQYTIQSNLKVDTTVFINNTTSRVGIGINTPESKLHINSSNTSIAQFTKYGLPSNEGTLTLGNNTIIEPNFIPMVRGRSSCAGRPFGFNIIGEADDIIPPANDAFGAAIVIDARSKTGTKLTNNNVLAINSYTTPLVMVKANGALCVNTTDPKGYMLAVNGSGIFTKVVVKNNANWPDYVFNTKYTLPPLAEVEKYISEHNKLPDLPSAEEVKNEGQDIAEVNRLLVQKVEELTLYIIKMNKRIAELEQKNK